MRRKHREQLDRRLELIENALLELSRQVERIGEAGRYIPRRDGDYWNHPGGNE